MTGKKFTLHLRKDKATGIITTESRKTVATTGKKFTVHLRKDKAATRRHSAARRNNTAPQGVTQRNDSFHYDTQHQRPTRHNDMVNPIINHKFWGVLVDSDLDNGG